MPGALDKDEEKKPRLATGLYNLVDCIALGASLLKAFMPETAEKILAQLQTQARDWDDLDKTGLYPIGNQVTDKPEILFARLDVDEVMDQVTAMEEARKPQPEIQVEPQLEEPVDFDTFCKSAFRAVKVKACEAVQTRQKLLRFTLDAGTGVDRQILSRTPLWYAPAARVGQTLTTLINFSPAPTKRL